MYVTDAGNVYQLIRRQAAALAFASTNVGSTSIPQTLTVSDAGNQSLTVTNLALTTNFAQVPSGLSDCTSSTQLSPAGQCLIAVSFAPASSGALTGAVTLTDNALNNAGSAQYVQLSGNGVQVAQTITFPTIPNQTYGAGPLSLNATASSALVVSYAVIAGPATISGNTLTITGVGLVTVQASQPRECSIRSGSSGISDIQRQSGVDDGNMGKPRGDHLWSGAKCNAIERDSRAGQRWRLHIYPASGNRTERGQPTSLSPIYFE